MRLRRTVLGEALGLGVALWGLLAAPTSAQGEFAPLPRASDDLQAEIDSLVARSAADAQTVARAEVEMSGLERQRDQTMSRLRVRVRAIARMRGAGWLPVAGGFSALLRHRSRLERLEATVSRDLHALREFERRAEALRHQIEQTRSNRTETEGQLALLRERFAEVRRQEGLGVTMPDALTAYGIRPSGGASDHGFASMRGYLPLPVSGSVTVEDGARAGGRGLEMRGSAGSRIRAVGAGRVIYADRHEAYGELVIVDHGGGYFTIFGGLARRTVRLGQRVRSGDMLGSLGVEPLFFQIRRDSAPLAARAWLGL